MKINILEELYEAGDSINDIESSLTSYMVSVSIARNKWQDLVDKLDVIIKQPQIAINDFEIDG
jgi:hypothetical protein